MHRIAVALGVHLHEVEDYPLDHIRRWTAYERLEGLPDPLLQTALLASLMYNPNRPKDSPALTPLDFLPGRAAAAPEPTDDQLWGQVRNLCASGWARMVPAAEE